VVRSAGLTEKTQVQYFLARKTSFPAVAIKGARHLYEASTEADERGENARERSGWQTSPIIELLLEEP
jgi:hypothetical protein